MKLENIHSIYFLGIGGIGMSALARYFNNAGFSVSGYDKTATELTAQLTAEGIDINYSDAIQTIPKAFLNSDKNKALVVYTPAIPAENKQLTYFRENDFPINKRSEILGLITANSKNIAVAGTHGKTTTSTLIAHILKNSGQGCNAFLGGISSNYNSNIILDKSVNTTVVEADEYDRSFLTLHPDLSIITSTDADHLDIYGSHRYLLDSFREFARLTAPDGNLIIKAGLDIDNCEAKIHTYSILQPADFTGENIRVENGAYTFDFVGPNSKITNIISGLPGRHNVENAVAAIAATQLFGVPDEEIKIAVESFKGVKRRFEYQIKQEDLIFIDDYAHHPKELKMCISSVRELYPGKKITGVFQPHLYTRTRDFADDFAESLSLLDELLLLDIYAAREQKITGVDSDFLLEKISVAKKGLFSFDEATQYLKSNKPEVLLTLGAGDIDRLVEPLKRALL